VTSLEFTCLLFCLHFHPSAQYAITILRTLSNQAKKKQNVFHSGCNPLGHVGGHDSYQVRGIQGPFRGAEDTAERPLNLDFTFISPVTFVAASGSTQGQYKVLRY
jgi:hypothetical protein